MPTPHASVIRQMQIPPPKSRGLGMTPLCRPREFRTLLTPAGGLRDHAQPTSGSPLGRLALCRGLRVMLAMRFGAKRRQERVERQGVDDVLLFNPAASRGYDAVLHELKM